MSDSESDGFQNSDVDSASEGYAESPKASKKAVPVKKAAAGPSKAKVGDETDLADVRHPPKRQHPKSHR